MNDDLELPNKAAALGRAIPRAALHPAAVATAESARGAGPWGVALSGGADSLALLLLVWAHWPERRGGLWALHFDHRLRGAASDGDREFCRRVCAALGISFRWAAWTTAPKDPSEAEARAARREFFDNAAAELGLRALWTGHQKNDIAETLMMRIARGSSAAGLAAPRPVQGVRDRSDADPRGMTDEGRPGRGASGGRLSGTDGNAERVNDGGGSGAPMNVERGSAGRVILRPLLTLEKAALTEALRACGIGWREDATNATDAFFRNRVRREVIPAWEAAAENAALDGAALTRAWMDEDDAALQTWLDERVPAAAYADDCFDARGLRERPRALWRRALRRWKPAASLAREGFEALLALCERGGGKMSAGSGVIVIRDGVLRWSTAEAEGAAPAWAASTLTVGASVLLPDGAELAAKAVRFSAELRARIVGGGAAPEREAFVAHFDGPFTVRFWEAGDRFQPLGAPGAAKLQDLFVNRKIPRDLRSTIPVVCASSGNIVWVPGFPPAENLKLSPDSVTGVHLTYHSGTYTVRP